MACGDQALSLIVATDFVRGHRTSRLQNPSLPRMRCDEHRVPTELSWLEVAKAPVSVQRGDAPHETISKPVRERFRASPRVKEPESMRSGPR